MHIYDWGGVYGVIRFGWKIDKLGLSSVSCILVLNSVIFFSPAAGAQEK